MAPRKRVKKKDTATKSEEKTQIGVSIRGRDKSRLPVEVLWGIADAIRLDLDEDYNATLQTLCSLARTCRALRDRVQKRLYHTVVLEDQYQFQAFAEAIEARPELAAHVKVLKCDVGSAWETRHALQDDEELLPESVVHLLVNVEELEITGINPGDYETSQPQCLTDFVMSFGDYRAATKVKKLTLKMLDFDMLVVVMPQFLYTFPKLESLAMLDVTWEPAEVGWGVGQEGDWETDESDYDPDEWDNVDSDYQLHRRRYSEPNPLPKLKRLELRFRPEHVGGLNLDEHGFSGVKELVLDLPHGFKFYKIYSRSLSTLRNIEVLKITLYKDNIHYLLTILHRLRPGATRLRQLVVCHVCEDQPRRESLDQLSELKLDVALAEPPFTGLWNVMWRVVTDDCGNRGGRWTNAIEKRLCGLRKRGLVLFYDVEKEK